MIRRGLGQRQHVSLVPLHSVAEDDPIVQPERRGLWLLDPGQALLLSHVGRDVDHVIG